jgi:hypothetical protein
MILLLIVPFIILLITLLTDLSPPIKAVLEYMNYTILFVALTLILEFEQTLLLFMAFILFLLIMLKYDSRLKMTSTARR